jgi:S1-C subfamily serine protease
MKTSLPALCALAALLVAPVRSARADDEATQFQNLVDKRAATIVNVRVVLKTEFNFGGNSQDRESRMELQGVVVDKEGLVMISNSAFNPGAMMGADMGENMKMVPTSFKVIFEGEEKEYNAFQAATDTKLSLAFIKVEELGDKKITVVDFHSSSNPGIGQQVVSVSRLRKGYDYAPYFETARVSGVISKPRKAWMLDGGIAGLGLPVYTLNGDVIGVVSTIQSGVKDDTSSDSAGIDFLMRMMTGGGGSGGMHAFIVPAASIQSVITQAKARAVEVAAERAKRKAGGNTKSESKLPAKQEGKTPAKKN